MSAYNDLFRGENSRAHLIRGITRGPLINSPFQHPSVTGMLNICTLYIHTIGKRKSPHGRRQIKFYTHAYSALGVIGEWKLERSRERVYIKANSGEWFREIKREKKKGTLQMSV